ncbi:MAG: glycosyltransferase family 39 protein [Vicinamibacterales bacterium]|nr:glycosyltransferase family 39 protein [Vicinamibacterales bacterium]
MRDRAPYTRLLVAIVLLGAALRLFPVWFGLPYLRARPDEDAAIDHAMGVLQNGPNPHFFHWPSLIFYVFAALFEAASWIHRAAGGSAVVPVEEQLVIARTFVAVAGTVTIAVLFDLARRIGDATIGLVAALFLAIAILHVRESHFAMTDVLMTLLVTASLAFLVRASDGLEEQAGRWFAAAGLAGGLATSTKYSAAIILIAMGAAQMIVLARLKWRPSLLFALAFCAGFLAGTPYSVLDYSAFSTDLKDDFAHMAVGHALKVDRAWVYHLRYSLPYGAGVPIFAAAVVGIIAMARHGRRTSWIVAAFAAAFLVSIGSGHTVFFRYILPLVPVVCLLAAFAVRSMADWMSTRTALSRSTVLGLVTASVAVLPFVNSVRFDVLLARLDTRVMAGRWLMARLTPDSTMHQAGGVFTDLYLPGVVYHRWHFYPEANSFGDPDGRTPEWLVLAESPLWTYATVPAELHRLAAEKYEVAQVVRGTSDGPAVYDLEDAFFLPLSGFGTVERPGPNITIYRRATPVTSLSAVTRTRRSWVAEPRSCPRPMDVRRPG